jgi:hypothetical protein
MRTCLGKVLSGERLECAVARSPGIMKVSVQVARSIGTRRAAAGMEDGRKFATGSWCVKLTSQWPSSCTLDVELSGRQSADGVDRQIFVATPTPTSPRRRRRKRRSFATALKARGPAGRRLPAVLMAFPVRGYDPNKTLQTPRIGKLLSLYLLANEPRDSGADASSAPEFWSRRVAKESIVRNQI